MCRPSEGNHIGLPLQRTETTHHEDGTMADESITEKIAVHHSALQLQQIPSAVIEGAKLHILDSLGCLLAGSVWNREGSLTILPARRVSLIQLRRSLGLPGEPLIWTTFRR